MLHAALVNDERIAQISALDEPHLEQGFDLAHKNEGAGAGDFRREVGHIFEHRALRLNKLAVGEHNGRVDRKMVARLHAQARSGDLIVVFKRFGHLEITTFGLLFAQTDALEFAHIEHGAAVEDGKFRTVDFDQAVVHFPGIERSHSVLDRGDAAFGSAHDGAARGVDHVFGQRNDLGMSVQVDATNEIAVIFCGGMESDGEVKTGVQSLTGKGERGLNSMLHRECLRVGALRFAAARMIIFGRRVRLSARSTRDAKH